MDQDLDQDLAKNLVENLVAMSYMLKSYLQAQLQGGFGGFDDDFFKGGFGWDSEIGFHPLQLRSEFLLCSLGSLRFSFLVIMSHVGHVKFSEVLGSGKVEELHSVPSVPAQEEVEAATPATPATRPEFGILCSAVRLRDDDQYHHHNKAGTICQTKRKAMSKALHVAYILYRNVQTCGDHADLYSFRFPSLVFLLHRGSASTCTGW